MAWGNEATQPSAWQRMWKRIEDRPELRQARCKGCNALWWVERDMIIWSCPECKDSGGGLAK